MVKHILHEQQDNQNKSDHANINNYITVYIKDVPVHRFGKIN